MNEKENEKMQNRRLMFLKYAATANITQIFFVFPNSLWKTSVINEDIFDFDYT